ncbi:MAG: aminoacyl-tRNA hydrolase [Alphaproteobacteria bacterium]|nr:aminoacyl-tRNA hydrolase [Alphaproteobacteria bacterium]
MHVVVGLGNPGARYADTRHNVGFLVVDTLARRAATSIDRTQHGALTGKAVVGGQPTVLAKPQQFMNLSGGPTQRLASFYDVPVDKVVVVHDEVDLPFGDVRVKKGGGHGGHNGIRDIVKHLGADCIRVRVGVSRPPEGWDTADYVLGRWSADEHAELPEVVDRAADAVEAVVRSGPVEAMNHFNTRGRA